jgi:cyclohexanone monooxygenase
MLADSPDGKDLRNRRDVVVVGAGFAGMYMLHLLRQRGFRVQVLEAGDDVGGTWYWNRYPGARCDIDSMAYSYSFDDDLQQEWHWPHRFAYQADILRYARHVAERFDLRRDILFGTEVTSAVFDEDASEWTLTTAHGERYIAPFCIMATGCLSVPKVPDIPGLDDFAGALYHTADWPREEIDFSGQSVGIIGTGSSGIQCIPIIARQAKHLTVFQRTPNFNVPSWNAPIPPEQEAEIKKNCAYYREKARHSISADFLDEARLELAEASDEVRRQELEKCWQAGGFDIQYAFSDLFTSEEASDIACEFVRDKIREIVRDPKVAETLCPYDHPIGSKRLCVDDAYYQTYNRDNVMLADLRCTPIKRIVPEGVRASDTTFELDALVLATGFDAMTGALTRIDIRGRDGRSLREAWAGGPRAYLGLAIADFPNLFTITGPGSPSVLTNMMVAIEQHVNWVGDCLVHMREHGIVEIEASTAAQDDWVRHVNETAEATLYPRANSWYVGANVPGKARVFMPYVAGQGPYKEICDRIAGYHYEGFKLAS